VAAHGLPTSTGARMPWAFVRASSVGAALVAAHGLPTSTGSRTTLTLDRESSVGAALVAARGCRAACGGQRSVGAALVAARDTPNGVRTRTRARIAVRPCPRAPWPAR